MRCQYNNQYYNPPAPVLPITVHIPSDSMKQITTDALVDTGADMTCLPKAIISALDAERASTYYVYLANGKAIGPSDTYFLEFEIAAMRKLIEVLALGDEPILGRNLINEFTIQLHGPIQELSIT